MSRFQIIAIALTVVLNALDGFDILSISFAAPGIAKEWGVDRAALGIVLSMELIGMAIGSVALGNVADRIGRRPTILGCLGLMALGMFLVTTAGNVTILCVWRLLTGLGIGGMLAAINAVAAEYSSTARRKICISIMVIGYPLGGVIGGKIAGVLLATHDWRAVFMFGAVATATMIPLVWFLLPETISFLVRKRPEGALTRINAVLARAGAEPVAQMPPVEADAPKTSIGALFSPALMLTTILVTLAYFAHVTTFYFILKWVPKIVVDMGFAPAAAAGVLVLGGLAVGIIGSRIGIRPVALAVLLCAVGAVILFGRGQADLVGLSLACAFAGFFTNGAITSFYTIFAEAFPADLRATGTGFAIGVGRGGSALSPIFAGFLLKNGYTLPTVATLMACGSLIAFFCLFTLWRAQPVEAASA
jgi:benzoate transport